MKKHISSLSFLLCILPFLAGGFYSFLSPLISMYLGVCLYRRMRSRGYLSWYLNDSICAIVILFLAYSLSWLWAENRGMACWGVARYLPILLGALVLMQQTPEEVHELRTLLPVSGGVMTILAFILRWVPGLSSLVLVNNRLAGFFGYPNAYAAFLLCCLVILFLREDAFRMNRFGRSYLLAGILVFGIAESGSRTAMVLLILLVCLVSLQMHSVGMLLRLGVLSAAAIGAELLLGMVGTTQTADRYAAVLTGSSTLMGRLLYFKDALGVILKHPLGLGYDSYYSMQGSFQTGVYSVRYVHNGILQIFLDVGWIPAFVFIFALIMSLVRRTSDEQKGKPGRSRSKQGADGKARWIRSTQGADGKARWIQSTQNADAEARWIRSTQSTDVEARLILLMLIGHSMMDFDLQFLSLWMILLTALNLHQGQELRIRGANARRLITAGAFALTLVTGWLGAADLAYTFGRYELSCRLTPWHTQAMEVLVYEEMDVEKMKVEAETLLKWNPHDALAHTALAEAAYGEGDVLRMMEEKEAAIACNRYSTGEYRDYVDKLWIVYGLYQEAGDNVSMEVVREKMLEIPEMLQALEAETSELAWKIADRPDLTLTQEQEEYLRMLESQQHSERRAEQLHS